MPFPQSLRTRACLFACLAALCTATWDFSTPDRWLSNVAVAADAENAAHKNRLAEETSPYLLLHAHNPIDWYPWGPEALEKAKKEDKPIFLSVGYSSCYWCHVMERKVFSDETIAEYMNEHFVNIKVDREERPDIDDLYMTALSIYQQAVGVPQSGGWPLSMFLTPDAQPLVGGTYFPPVAENGMIAFPDLAEKVHDIWTTRREQAESNADFLTHHLKRTMTRGLALKTVPLERTLVDGVVAAVAGEYDKQHGGFGFIPGNDLQPKFPTASKLVLLQYEAARGNEDAAKMVANTLDHMADGGIWDHLGGGFHRYSVDRYWHVPHFEKMLYDNAQLADVYTQAFRQTGDPRYRRITEDILAFVKRDMTSPEGAFYSAIDAETDAVEGKSYLWTEDEIATVLSEADAKMFAMAYGLDNQPELEDHHVLRKTAEVRDVAQEFGISVEEAQQRLDKARGELLAARQQRKAPLTDDKIMADWNGLMIRAYANAGAALNHPEYVQTAERAARFVLENMRDPQGGLLHTYRGGQAKFPAYVDDYAFLVDGLLALHAATGNHEWLDTARDLTDAQLKGFWDEDNGGCFFTAVGQEELLARGKQRFDNATPSGNSVTVRNLLRLATLTGDPSYRQKAEQALTSMAPLLKQAPLGVTHLAVAAAEFLDAPQDPQPKENGAEQGAAGGHGPVMRLVSALAAGDKKKDPEIVTGKAYLSVDRLPAGQTCEVIVVLKIDEAWHINANPPGDEFALPTEFTMKSKLKTKLGKVKYPKGKEMEVTGFDNPLFVYTKQAVLRSTLEVPAEAGGKKEEMELSIRYQACDDKRCLRPMTLKLKVPVAVAREGEEVKKINEKLFNPKKKNGEDEEN